MVNSTPNTTNNYNDVLFSFYHSRSNSPTFLCCTQTDIIHSCKLLSLPSTNNYLYYVCCIPKTKKEESRGNPIPQYTEVVYYLLLIIVKKRVFQACLVVHTMYFITTNCYLGHSFKINYHIIG